MQYTKTLWQHSEEYICHLRNIAMLDYQESVTSEQTDGGTERCVVEHSIDNSNRDFYQDVYTIFNRITLMIWTICAPRALNPRQ